jgi:hypothetical protein
LLENPDQRQPLTGRLGRIADQQFVDFNRCNPSALLLAGVFATAGVLVNR